MAYLVPQKRGRRLSYYLVTGAQPNPFGTNPFTGNYGAPTLSGLGSTRASRRALQRVFAIQRRGRRLNGFGDDTQYDIEGNPIASPTYSLYDPTSTTYSLPTDTVQPTNPITAAYQNLLTSAQPSQSPLDYVSPQAAISAGLNPNTVNAAWAQSLAKFPTQQAAVTSGVPAGVVTQLWPASRAVAPGSTGIGSILSGNMGLIALIGGGVLLLGAMRRK